MRQLHAPASRAVRGPQSDPRTTLTRAGRKWLARRAALIERRSRPPGDGRPKSEYHGGVRPLLALPVFLRRALALVLAALEAPFPAHSCSNEESW